MPSTFSVTLISKVERGNLLPEPCAKDPHLGRWTLVPANECVKAPRRQGPSIIKDIGHALVQVRRKGAILVVEQYFEWVA